MWWAHPPRVENDGTTEVAQTHSEAKQRRAIFRAGLGRELNLHDAVTVAPQAADARDERQPQTLPPGVRKRHREPPSAPVKPCGLPHSSAREGHTIGPWS